MDGEGERLRCGRSAERTRVQLLFYRRVRVDAPQQSALLCAVLGVWEGTVWRDESALLRCQRTPHLGLTTP